MSLKITKVELVVLTMIGAVLLASLLSTVKNYTNSKSHVARSKLPGAAIMLFVDDCGTGLPMTFGPRMKRASEVDKYLFKLKRNVPPL